MSDLYDAARLFDKPYENFRLDVRLLVDVVEVSMWFHLGESAPDTVNAATKELWRGIQHQVRPHGRCTLDTSTWGYSLIVLKFEERRTTGFTVKRLLDKMILLAHQVEEQFNLG